MTNITQGTQEEEAMYKGMERAVTACKIYVGFRDHSALCTDNTYMCVCSRVKRLMRQRGYPIEIDTQKR